MGNGALPWSPRSRVLPPASAYHELRLRSISLEDWRMGLGPGVESRRTAGGGRKKEKDKVCTN